MTPARPPADPGAPAVEVEDLSVVLGSSLILSGIDLRIEPGESVANSDTRDHKYGYH